MTVTHRLGRGGFLTLVVTTAWTLIAACESQTLAAPPADQAMQRLANQYIAHQLPDGGLDSAWAPWAPNGSATEAFCISLISIEMYKAFDATGNQAYKTYADRGFDYFYQHRSTAAISSATAAILLDNWAAYKQRNPQSTQYDAGMASVYNQVMSYRWDEPSYFRCGYKGADGLDVAFACDLSLVGSGLLSYSRLTGNMEALEAAQGIAPYLMAEMSPMTFQGAWSSDFGTWAVGPTSVIGWEHHSTTPANTVAWGAGSQNTIAFLKQLYPTITDTTLKQEIKEKCVASMKWQFDQCQFPNGAVGMCGLDDQWVGMADAAIQTFLWNRDSDFLSSAEILEYAPKAQAAADWTLGLMATDPMTADVANRGGYYLVTGQSENTSGYDKMMSRYYLSWSFDALSRYDDIMPAPEPSALMLLAVGLVGLLGYVRRFGKYDRHKV